MGKKDILLNVSFLNPEAAQAIPIAVVKAEIDSSVFSRGSNNSSENSNSETSTSGNRSLKKEIPSSPNELLQIISDLNSELHQYLVGKVS